MKIVTPLHRLLTITVLSFASASAFASYFKISPIIQDTQGERVNYIITSENESNDQYIQMKVTKVISPKNGDEEEVPLDSLHEIKVIPEKLILKPNDQKRVQVVILQQDVEKEQVYRVYFSQVSAEEYFSDSENILDVSGKTSMTLALGSVLRIIPRKNNEDIKVYQENIKNMGNTHFRITEECIGLTHDTCIWTKPETTLNMYSGNEYFWKTQENKEVMKIKFVYPQDKKVRVLNKD